MKYIKTIIDFNEWEEINEPDIQVGDFVELRSGVYKV